MCYYSSNNLPGNLYPSPAGALANADALSGQISALQASAPSPFGSPFMPGVSYAPFSVFNPGGGFGYNTNMNYTMGPNGGSYSYSSSPSAVTYFGAIGAAASGIIGSIYAGQAAQASTQMARENQQFQFQMFQRQSEMNDRLQMYQMGRQQQQDSINSMMQLFAMQKMMKSMDEA